MAGPTFVVADHLDGTYLLDLEDADQIRDDLIAALEQARSGSILSVSLERLTTRASCVARFLGTPLNRIAAGEIPGRYLVLLGPLDYLTERDVRLALEDEGVVTVIRDADRARLIGTVGRVLEETYEALLHSSEVTSAALMAPPLALDIKTANARMAKLEDVGLLHRTGETSLEAGGRRYVYQLIQ
jgi:hypothetical protein